MDNKKRRNVLITISIVYIVIVIALYACIYLIPHISDALTSTYVVNTINMDNYYYGKAVIVRSEECVYSPDSGNISYYVEESEKTRIGTRVVDIYASNDRIGLFCPVTGFVSYYQDGYEEILTPESVFQLDPKDYFDIEAVSVSSERAAVTKGDFVYKVVDGGTWYLMLPITEEQLQTFRIGSNIEVLLEDGTTLKAEAERVLGDETLAIMAKVLSYYPDFCKIRTLQARVSIKQTKGLGVPTTAVTYIDGNPGVYVLGTDSEYHFTRVNILDEKDGYYAVSEDHFTELKSDGNEVMVYSISLYDEILRDASNRNSE